MRLPFSADAIVRVTLGPTNPTPPLVVEAALKKNGIECGVGRSIARYRTN